VPAWRAAARARPPGRRDRPGGPGWRRGWRSPGLVLAQVAVGLGDLLRAGGAAVLFEAGFLLAGTVLPLALVYRWGRVFPGWVPLLAGRGVPRWLVLGPALGLGVGMTAYFGLAMVQLAVETVTGTWEQHAESYPLWFFWVAIPAYLVWGLGLGAAAGLPPRDPSPMPDLRPLIAEPPLPLRGPRAGEGRRPSRAACGVRHWGRTPSSRRSTASSVVAMLSDSAWSSGTDPGKRMFMATGRTAHRTCPDHRPPGPLGPGMAGRLVNKRPPRNPGRLTKWLALVTQGPPKTGALRAQITALCAAPGASTLQQVRRVKAILRMVIEDQ
jgi:hypothetical protein